MNGASRDFPAGQLRVSDADRDRAVSELSEHFQAGRLTSDEFDERSGLALRARTGSDLATLLADLPRSEAPAPAQAGPGAPVVRRSWPLLVAPVVIALAVLAAGLLSGHNGHYTVNLLPVFIVLFIVLRLGRGARRRGRDRDRDQDRDPR